MTVNGNIDSGSQCTKGDIIQAEIITISSGCIVGHLQHYGINCRRGGKLEGVLTPLRWVMPRHVAGTKRLDKRPAGGLDSEGEIRQVLAAVRSHIQHPHAKLVLGRTA